MLNITNLSKSNLITKPKTIMKLKQRMTFEEMEQYMTENTALLTNKTSVGRYAKKLGYSVYRPMVAKKVLFFYVNEKIGK